MLALNRRSILTALAAIAAALSGRASAAPLDEPRRGFVAAAFAMKQRAIDGGDQAYGAVIVRDITIVGWGPSRVVTKKDLTAHAEREAIRDAQARLARNDLSDCVMYSTSQPCSECQRAAVEARLGRMYAGADAADLGPPRR